MLFLGPACPPAQYSLIVQNRGLKQQAFQAGPGEIMCDLDGVDCTELQWKCNAIEADQEPEQAYPDIFSESYDAASWDNLVVSGHAHLL